jgi:hypothetical protein
MVENGIVVEDFNKFLDPGAKLEEMFKDYNNACRVILYLSTAAANESMYVSNHAAPMLALGVRRRDPTLLPVFLDESSLPHELAEIQRIQGVYAPGRSIKEVIKETLLKVRSLLSRDRVFVCHSSRDRDRARKLCDDLMKIHPESDFWFDSDAVPAGVDIELGIRAGMSRARYFLVFMRRALVETLPRSKYLKLEFQLAKEREQRRRESGSFFVIPVRAAKDFPIDDDEVSWLKTDNLVNLCNDREEGLQRIVCQIRTAVDGRL